MKRKSFLTLIIVCILAIFASAFTACNIQDGNSGTGSGNGGTGGNGGSNAVAVESVIVTPTALELEEGETAQLYKTVKPANATDQSVVWESSNDEVATVSQKGEVVAVAEGTAIVTVKTSNGKTATCTVKVKAKQSTTTPENPDGDTKPEQPDKPDEPNPPAHTSHTYKYEDLNATSHKKTCTGCTDINVTENHVYENDKDTTCDLCKHVRTVEEEKPDNPNPPVTVTKFTVTFISNGVTITDLTEQIEEGKTVTEPDGVTREGYTLKHWAVGSESGAVYDFSEPVDKDLNLYAVWEKDKTETPDKPDNPPDANTPVTYSYAGNECAAFEWTESNAAKAKVEYKQSAQSESAYAAVDKELIRDIGSGKARVDIVGLAGGVKYDFKITTSSGGSYTKTNVEISKYDRSGYAHFGKTDGVGAYKDDGTIKDKAIVVYVTEANKNTVKATVNGKERTGIVSILQNAGTSTPLVVRIIGTVGAATWNKIDYNADKKYSSQNKMPLSAVKDKNGKALAAQAWTQKELIDGGHNSLNTSVYSELKGLSSKITYKSNEFDSCWNDCPIENVKNVTVEGIGEDARIFQWGLSWKNCNSVEVRNLTFEDYTEDACSFEGSQTSAKNLSDFKSKNFWIHHNTFEQGINYWDVCAEQDKHEGDGATDFKGISNVTVSYNVYHDNHKTGLVGGSNSQTTANVTFHHNYYNHCSSRLPLARQANMHMYNNYYYNTTGTNMSLRAGAYALVENCYFENANNPIVIEKRDADYGIGAAKLIGNVFSGNQPASNDYLHKVTVRTQPVTNENIFSKTFDTDSSVFYYKNGQSDVTEMLTAEQVKTEIPKVAGVQKRGDGTVSGGTSTGGNTGGDNTGDTPTTPTTPATDKVTYTYKVENNKAVASANANGTIAVTGQSDTTNDSANASDFKFESSNYTVTITVDANAGQKVAVKLTGYTGSRTNGVGNAVGANVEATNATMTSASKEIPFSGNSSLDSPESGTVEFVATANGKVTITIKRSVSKTARVTNIEVTVG